MVHYLVFEDPDADDLVQLSLVEILQSIRTFGGRSTLETWADRITVRTCMRALKRRQRERQRNQIIAGTVAGGEGETPPSMKAPTLDGPHQAVSRVELRRALALSLRQLSPPQRVIVVLRHVHGYSIKEIAGIVGAPANTVRDRLQVGKRRLRRLIVADPVLREWAEVMGR